MEEQDIINYVFRILDILLWYYMITVAIGVVVWCVGGWERGLLAGYVFLLFAKTILIRSSFSGIHFQPELLWSWRVWKRRKTRL